MKRTFTAKVVSAKMQNTIVVLIERTFRHPLYKKVIKRRKKIKADTKGLAYEPGDVVVIESTRPLSKDKHFMVVSKKS